MPPIHWPSWWPRQSTPATPQVAPEVTLQVTPQVASERESGETAFQNWARRLLIGPRDIVRQQLADAAALEREERAGARETLRESGRDRRSRENIILNIREQARVQQEKEEREADERKGISRLLQLLAVGQPSGEPSAPPAPEELFQFKGGREAYQAQFPKPPTPEVFQDKQGNIRDKRTGRVVEPAPARERFTPPEGYVPSYIETPEGEVRTHYTLPAMPYGLDAIAQKYLDPKTKKPYRRYAELPSELKAEALKEAERLQGQFAGSRESGRYASEVTQAVAEKAGEYVHPETYASPHPDLPRATVWREYRHVPRAGSGGARSLLTVREALTKLVGVIQSREDLYPREGLISVQQAKRATWPLAKLRGDPDVATVGALVSALPTFVRAFGDVGNIAYVEQLLHKEALGLEGDSRAAALNRVKTVLDLINSRLQSEGLRPFTLDALDKALAKQKPSPKSGTKIGIGDKKGKVLD